MQQMQVKDIDPKESRLLMQLPHAHTCGNQTPPACTFLDTNVRSIAVPASMARGLSMEGRHTADHTHNRNKQPYYGLRMSCDTAAAPDVLQICCSAAAIFAGKALKTCKAKTPTEQKETHSQQPGPNKCWRWRIQLERPEPLAAAQ